MAGLICAGNGDPLGEAGGGDPPQLVQGHELGHQRVLRWKIGIAIFPLQALRQLDKAARLAVGVQQMIFLTGDRHVVIVELQPRVKDARFPRFLRRLPWDGVWIGERQVQVDPAGVNAVGRGQSQGDVNRAVGNHARLNDPFGSQTGVVDEQIARGCVVVSGGSGVLPAVLQHSRRRVFDRLAAAEAEPDEANGEEAVIGCRQRVNIAVVTPQRHLAQCGLGQADFQVGGVTRCIRLGVKGNGCHRGLLLAEQ